MLWHLEGPDQRWFTREEVVAYLKVSARTLARLISEGRFPRGTRAAPRAEPRWSGLDLAAYDHLIARCQEGPVDSDEEEES